jgi:hypothetical protein
MAATLNNAQVNQFLASQGLAQNAGSGQANAAISGAGLDDAFARFQVAQGGITDAGTINQINAVPQGAGRGVVPMTTEPLHGYEKTGLNQLANQNTGNFQQVLAQLQAMNANPQGTAANYTNPNATRFMDAAGSATSAGLAPVTAEQIQGQANPYAAGMKTNLNEAGQRARAMLTANQGVRGARSFGDTSTGQQLGAIDAETLKGGREIDYNTFETARDQLNTERNRSIQGGGQFGQLATGAQGITSDALRSALAGLTGSGAAASDAFNISRTAAQDTLGAGGYIRKYNQGINDKLESDILAEGNYSKQNLNDIIAQLNAAFGGGTSYSNTPTANNYQIGSQLAGTLAELIANNSANKGSGTTSNKTGNAANFDWSVFSGGPNSLKGN